MSLFFSNADAPVRGSRERRGGIPVVQDDDDDCRGGSQWYPGILRMYSV